MNNFKNPRTNKNDENFLRFRKGQYRNNIPLLKSNKKYIDLGLISGGSILSIVGIISIFLIIQSFYYRTIRRNLEPFVNEHDNLVQVISFKEKELSEIKRLNKSLINSILSIRSGSAILSEISKLIPKSIVLNELSVKENDLEIKGFVDDIEGLEVINLFIIEMNKSLFIKDGTVKLVKASKAGKSKQINNDYLAFLLKANIKEDIRNLNKTYIKKLGSYGLFKRIDNIKERGLLK